MAAGGAKQVLAEIKLGTPVWSNPCAANRTLFVASQKNLWAVEERGASPRRWLTNWLTRRFKSLEKTTTPGWTRTSDPGIRNLRRGDLAVSEEITKSTFRRCQATTSGSRSDFAWVPSFTTQRAEKAADLRNPQIKSWPSRTNDSSLAEILPDGLKGSA
ncbi:MAG: hypothetical protein WCH77_06650 [Planctomycetota bacterium]